MKVSFKDRGRTYVLEALTKLRRLWIAFCLAKFSHCKPLSASPTDGTEEIVQL